MVVGEWKSTHLCNGCRRDSRAVSHSFLASVNELGSQVAGCEQRSMRTSTRSLEGFTRTIHSTQQLHAAAQHNEHVVVGSDTATTQRTCSLKAAMCSGALCQAPTQASMNAATTYTRQHHHTTP